MLSQPFRESDIDGKRGKLFDNWKEIRSSNAALKSIALSQLFGSREVYCFAGSEFWVFADCIQDTQAIKAIANAYGFINLETIIPKVGHPDDETKSIPDPDHAFAVRVCSLEDMIFGEGDGAAKWLKLNEPLINPVREHIIFTYCYNSGSKVEAKLTFSNKDIADIFFSKMLLLHSDLKDYGQTINQSCPDVQIAIDQTAIDNWQVSFTLHHLA